MPKNKYQNLIDYQKLRTKNKVEGEQKLNTLGQMSTYGTIILAKRQLDHSYIFEL